MPMILGVAAVLAVVAGAITLASRGGAQQARSAGNVQLLYVQAQLIRTRIIKCAFDYPGGNNGTGFHLSLPGAATDTPVSALTCPGAPVAVAGLWNGTDAVWLPDTPDGFSAWTYRNDATSARLFIQATNDSGVNTLDAVRARFSAAEASVNSGTRTLTLIIQT